MYLVFRDFLAHHDMSWIISRIIIYADDIHLRWIIHNMSMGYKALHDLAFVLSTFKAYHFRVNLTKGVTVIRLLRNSAQAFLKRWTTKSKEGPRLNLPDIALSLPLVGKTDYLGVVLSYRAFDHDIIQRRIAAANVCFCISRKWFLDRHAVRQGTLGVDGRGRGPVGNIGRRWSWLRPGEKEKKEEKEKVTNIKFNNLSLINKKLSCCK